MKSSTATLSYRRLLIIAGVLLVAFVMIVMNYFYIGTFSKYIISPQDSNDNSIVGVVLGGGIQDGQPRPLLRDRLNTAAKLIADGKVRKIVVSGDNRFVGYNEPDVMKDYLVKEKGVDPRLIEPDYAGRSTYETCERAKKIFGLDKALFVSESTHLPRVMYLCRSFGIESYGVASDGVSSAGIKAGQRFREFQARIKATINVYVVGERTVLGDKIII